MMVNAHRLDQITFVAFDTETTGISALSCKIVEIAAVKFGSDGKVVGTFEQLVNPECLIPANVIRIHGITNEMVREQPAMNEVIPRFLAFLGASNTILLAHNARFDIAFLGNALAQHGYSPPEHLVLDTVPLARACWPGLSSYNLETIGRSLKLIEATEHRALADAWLLKEVFLRFLDSSQLKTWTDLAALATLYTFTAGRMISLPVPPSGFEELQTAIAEGRAITMIYSNSQGIKGRRIVTPLALLRSRGMVYLSAFCHRDQLQKLYRLDRISHIARLSDSAPLLVQ
ncbi:MAG: 3'-5' exoribonuclease [Cyanobacteria bacterium NC_groundwater_1444_Ag_S-0.65um_54_12]|nr:3'-5' exoribonuclease [Cyanobacteria bacterium NC_groundwater_1444_Ag_S-0.65um_54_12]